MKAFAFGATMMLMAANGATAQDSSWTYSTTIYGWIAGMNTEVETIAGSIETEASFSDILSNLDMVFMGSLEARRDRLGFVGDLVYLDLAAENETPLALFGDASVDVTATILSGYALYRVTSDQAAAVDIGAGFRSFDMDLDLAVSTGALPGFSQSVGGSWVDPLIAARVLVPVIDAWTLTGFADWGGSGGGEETWQVFGSAKYAINDKWSTQIGYRHMEISTELDGRDVDLEISGPVVAVAFKF
jgi:hypothetical protein